MTTSSSENCPDCGRPIPEGAPQGLCPKCLLSEAAIETVNIAGNLPDDPSLEEVSAAFPNLEILERVGAGGMGTVYKARQRRLDRLVALKLLRCHPEQEAQFADRFLREGRALAKLSHPHIVTVFDFGEAQGFYYLLMEYVDGVNLRQAMAGKQLTAEEALRIVPVVCSALQYAHEQGVLHRDIKPANILINRAGEVKMADFGLAKFIGETSPADQLTRTEASLGTPAYMAPEQTTDPGHVDHRADIYSLGVVFYEMLTGDLPLGRFPAPSSKASVDQRVDDVVLRTLEREPEERYQSAKDVKTDVEHLSTASSLVESNPPPVQMPPPASPRESSSTNGRKLIWRGVIGAVLVFGSLVPSLAFLAAVVHDLRQSAGSPIAGVNVIILLVILTALILGTVGTGLGWSAVGRIRSEPKRFWGLPFASFAAMCWPILCLTLAFSLVGGLRFMGIGLCVSILVGVLLFRAWYTRDLLGKRGYVAPALIVVALGVAMFYRSSRFEHRQIDAPAPAGMSEDIDLDARDSEGNTPLINAAINGETQRVQQILRQGADPEVVNYDGLTAFLAAARLGQPYSVETLIQGNANLHAVQNSTGNNALHLAATGRRLHRHYPQVLTVLQEHGLSVQSRNAKGQTPLMLALLWENGDYVQWLHGVREALPLVDHENRTALDYAVLHGQTKWTNELTGMGAPKTASWWLLQTYLSRSDSREKMVANIRETLAALNQYPVEELRFGMSWRYTFPHPEIALNAMMVEAAAAANQMDAANESSRVCLAAWPEAEESLVMMIREKGRGSARTVQTLNLDRADIDQPLRHEFHHSALNGTTRTGVAEQPLQFESFFK